MAAPAKVDSEQFAAEDVATIIKESVDKVLQGQQFEHSRVDGWVTSCQEQCLQRLLELHQPYKYVVTTIIFQKTGAGLHTALSCYWDQGRDGSKTLRWENKTMYAITTVFGLSL